MASRVTINRTKFKRLKKGMPKVANALLDDSANEFREKLVSETIAGSPGTLFTAAGGSRTVVGVQTGNLRRSYSIVTQGDLRIVGANESAAPYARAVASNVLTRQGRDYLRTTEHFHMPRIRKEFEKEVKRFTDAVSDNRPYSYSNPFT